MSKVTPIRRDLRFPLPPERINDWHDQGPQVTQLINALSLFFPLGERFFIKSLRNYRPEINDAEIEAAVKAFIGQEAMHGREHENFNALIEQAGLPAEALEKRVGQLLGWMQKHTSQESQLQGTIALEHITAILADVLLTSPDDVLGDSNAAYSNLLRWHALEETEHKGVAFDVYQAVVPQTVGSYARRCGWLAISSILLFSMLGAFQQQCLKVSTKDLSRREKLRGWAKFTNFMLGKPGIARRLTLPWLGYMKPGFHPWDHDNRHLLSELEPLEEAYRYSKKRAA